MRDNGFELLQTDYMRFRDLLQQRSGLYFPEEKRQMLTRGLGEALGFSACNSLGEYYELLRGTSSTHQEWDRLVSILTVGETYFFRNKGHFDALSRHILPEIIARRERFNRRIRIWSAGCATGEEPYSIAMLLRQLIPNLASWNILILATDINRDVLRRARQGLYGPWSFRGVEKRYQDRYFRLNGKQYAISDEIKRMVTFDYLNLIEDYYPSLSNNTGGMDLILCRNVTIYFSAEITGQVVGKFHSCLMDGGWFIPGASEPNLITYKAFDHKSFPGAVVYKKAAAQPARLAPVAAAPKMQPLPEYGPLAATPEPALPVARRNGETSSLPDLYQTAVQLLESGRMDEALIKLYAKLDEDPHFVPAYCMLGKIYANKGNLEEAQHWCERAIGKDKLQPEPYFTLSMIYQGHGLVDKAVAALKKTLYLDPTFILAHYTLANLYRQRGEKEPASRSLRNVQRLLVGRPQEEPIPEGDGLVVGRLQELVTMELANGR